MKLKVLLSYLTIYLVWGSTYFAIKLCVQTIPPFSVVGLRFLFGGAFLVALVALQKRASPLPSRNEILSSIFIGILLLIGGNGLITVAQKKVDSYLAALLVAACPMAVMLWDRLFLGKRLTLSNSLGVLLGITGVGLLLYEGHSGLPVLSPEIGLVGAGVVLWALGTSLSKKLPLPKDSVVNAAIQLSCVGIIVMAGIMPFSKVGAVTSAPWTPASIAGLAYLTVFGSIALVAYSYLLKHEPNHRIVTYVFVNPPLALLLGLVAGKETAVPFLIPALVLLLGGLGLVFYGKKAAGIFTRNS